LGLFRNEYETGQAMLKAWLRIIMCRKFIDGNRCLKDQLEDRKTLWEDDVSEDTKSINRGNWKKVAQNRDSLE